MTPPARFRIEGDITRASAMFVGDKMAGPAVHLGRQLTLVAAFGEVLISHTVRDLVAGSGLEFERRGSKTFDGVPGQWSLFAVGRSSEVAPHQ